MSIKIAELRQDMRQLHSVLARIREHQIEVQKLVGTAERLSSIVITGLDDLSVKDANDDMNRKLQQIEDELKSGTMARGERCIFETMLEHYPKVLTNGQIAEVQIRKGIGVRTSAKSVSDILHHARQVPWKREILEFLRPPQH